MIKQLSIAATSDGVIGYGGGLAFWCSQDLVNFKKLTDKTVVIVGRLTAEEMLSKGMKPDDRRPMVIISSDVSHKVGAGMRNVYRANKLDDAIEMAESVARMNGLIGWTVAGGRTVYEEFFASKHKLDHVYLATIDADQSHLREEAILKLDIKGTVRDAISRHMTGIMIWTGAKSLGIAVDVHGDCGLKQSQVANVDFQYLCDMETFNPCGIRFNDGWLEIDSKSGSLSILSSDIIGTLRERERSSITLICCYGKEHVIRLDSEEAGLNYLQYLINKHCK